MWIQLACLEQCLKNVISSEFKLSEGMMLPLQSRFYFEYVKDFP